MFSVYPDRWQDRRAFLEQIREALELIPLLRVLLAMREDYIAHLDPYLHIFSDKLRIRMRLELLRESAAIRAIEDPLGVTNKRFGEGVAKKIVSELLQVRTRNELGETVLVAGEFVEPVQLQVVCQTLWESLPSDLDVVDEGRLSDFGDVDQALRVFYDGIIRQAVEKMNHGEKTSRPVSKELQLRSWIDDKLIAPGNTRGMVNEQDEQTKAIPADAIEHLVSKHLVRGERRHGSRWFELAHDRFLKPIQESNLRFAQSYKTRLETIERFSAIVAIVSSATAGYLLSQSSGLLGLLITCYFLFSASCSGGISLGMAIRKISSRKNPISNWRAGAVALAFFGSIVYFTAEAIISASWWLLGGYFTGLVFYAFVFRNIEIGDVLSRLFIRRRRSSLSEKKQVQT